MPISGAHGSQLSISGHQIEDWNGGYWTVILGHRNPAILSAMGAGHWGDLFNFIHDPAEVLAETLVKGTGHGKAILTSSGSSAADIAIRVGYQVTTASRPNAKQVLSLRRGYHGSTALTLACGGQAYSSWIPSLKDVAFVFDDERALAKANGATARALEYIPWESIRVFIFEYVQGVGGLRIVDPGLLACLLKECHRRGIPTIADEITTGLYRGQRLLYGDHLGLRADMTLMGKSLTNGEFPLAVALLRNDIWQRVESSGKERSRYLWGETYAGHPSGCAAALAVLELAGSEEYRGRRQVLQCQLQGLASRLARSTKVKSVRLPNDFLALGIELEHVDGGQWLVSRCLERGIRLGLESGIALVVPMFNFTSEMVDNLGDVLLDILGSG